MKIETRELGRKFAELGDGDVFEQAAVQAVELLSKFEVTHDPAQLLLAEAMPGPAEAKAKKGI